MRLNEFIGQDKVKSKLEFHLAGYKAGEPMPSLFFVSARGMGKTEIAKAVGMEQKAIDAARGVEKKFYLINSAEIKNTKQLVDTVFLPLVQDRYSTIFFDECHMLAEKVAGAMLTVLSPNEAHSNTYTTADGMVIDVNLKNVNFIMATTNPEKVSLPLANRHRRFDLVDYSYVDVEKILQKNAKTITFKDDTLPELAAVCRHTPRNAVMMAEDVQTHLAPLKRTFFTHGDWQTFKHKLGVLPLGLTGLELGVLETLNKRKNASLTALAATMNMAPESLRRDAELYLLKNGLLEICKGSGRNLTGAGQQYLKALEKW